jgi:hypothetical protein
MGLLENAIREHLELKRQQGADPGEIAEKEREALEPVDPGEPTTWGMEHDPAVEGFGMEYSDAQAPERPAAASQDDSLQARAVELSAVGQETAEIDMREVFGELEEIDRGGYPADMDDGVRVRVARITGQPKNEVLDWQTPAHTAGEMPPEQIPGQESLAFE